MVLCCLHQKELEDADVLVGAVGLSLANLLHVIITQEMIKRLGRSVIVDIAIDQGGCVEAMPRIVGTSTSNDGWSLSFIGIVLDVQGAVHLFRCAVRCDSTTRTDIASGQESEPVNHAIG